MVVRHLFAVADLSCYIGAGYGQITDQAGVQCYRRHGALHVIRKITAVRPGIGAAFFLIERLCIIKGLLSSKAQDTVSIPLKRCQVVKRRSLFRLFLLLNGADNRCLSFAFAQDFFGSFLRLEFFTGRTVISEVQIHGIEGLRLKSVDLCLTLNEQRQCRGHDAAHIQRPVVEYAEKPRGVDSHEPVRFGTAVRGK